MTTESPILQLVEHVAGCGDCAVGLRDQCERGSALTDLALDEEICEAFDNEGRPDLPASLFPDAFEFWGEPELGEAGA